MAADETDGGKKPRQEPPPIEFLKPGEAQAPPSQPSGPVAWVPTPDEFQRRPPPPPRPQAGRAAPGNRGTLAGVCLILSGVLGFVGLFLIFLIRPTLQDFNTTVKMTDAEWAQNVLLNMVVTWPPVFSIIGGALCFQRKNHRLATVCALISVANLFSPYFLGTVLAILGILLVARARPEFAS